MSDLPVSEGAEIIRGGAALVKAQDDTMLTIAVQRPREVATVREKVLAELEAFPDFADRYFYSIPHRTKACNHQSGQLCPNCALVEGASVHAALAIQRYWGNCFSSWMPLEEEEEHIWILGTFVDYESNTKFQRPIRVQKGYKKGKNWIPLRDDGLAKVIHAGGSKAQRNAILAGVPDALKILVFTKAKELVVGDKPDEMLSKKQMDAIESEFAKFEVSIELLESKLGKKSTAWAMRDRATLLGLRTSLADGASVQELFGSTIRKSEAVPVDTTRPITGKDREEFYRREREEWLEDAARRREQVAAAGEPIPITGEPIEEEPPLDVEIPRDPELEPTPSPEPDPFTSDLFGD